MHRQSSRTEDVTYTAYCERQPNILSVLKGNPILAPLESCCDAANRAPPDDLWLRAGHQPGNIGRIYLCASRFALHVFRISLRSTPIPHNAGFSTIALNNFHAFAWRESAWKQQNPREFFWLLYRRISYQLARQLLYPNCKPPAME